MRSTAPSSRPHLAPVRRAFGRRACAAIVATATVLATVGLATPAAHAASMPADATPKAWDPQVAPIAAKVAKLRGLRFEHPVPVHYLSDAAFRKRVAVNGSKLTGAERRDVAQLTESLRAVGLIDAHTDLVRSLDTLNQSGVLAFYDPKAKDVVIRGTGPLDVDHRATLAHELTHVLQDQHFDLQKLRHDASSSDASSSSALSALVEGDAERIKDAYLQGLSKADRDAYDQAEAKTDDAVGEQIASASELVKIEFAAPYALGPLVLKLLIADGGNRAVDRALQQRTQDDAILVDPVHALQHTQAVSVDPPKLPPGAKRIGKPDEIGAFDLFLMLASRLDPARALDGADAWGGDRVVTYRSKGEVCARSTIVSPTTAAARTLAGALQAWSATMPKASVVTDAAKRRATFTSCDNGAIPSPSAAQLQQALQLLAGRSSLLTSLVSAHAPVKVADCVSRQLVKEPVVASNLDKDQLPPEVTSQIQHDVASLAAQCRGGS